MNTEQQEVYTRLVRSMQQLDREMNGLPNCSFTVTIADGELTIAPVEPPQEAEAKRPKRKTE